MRMPVITRLLSALALVPLTAVCLVGCGEEEILFESITIEDFAGTWNVTYRSVYEVGASAHPNSLSDTTDLVFEVTENGRFRRIVLTDQDTVQVLPGQLSLDGFMLVMWYDRLVDPWRFEFVLTASTLTLESEPLSLDLDGDADPEMAIIEMVWRRD
jgi:hypothetical protein